MSSSERWILAIDGGGTKTDAVLACCMDGAAPDVVARAQSGPSNPTTHGPAALKELARAIAEVAGQAHVGPTGFSIALLALAGAADEESRQLVVDWAEGHGDAGEPQSGSLAEEVYVISDAELVLAIAEGSARDDQVAMGLIAGTGSVAFGRAEPDAELLRIGGWGPLLGDDGGGFWMGRQAIRHVLAELDGDLPPSPLQERILEFADARSSRELVASVYVDSQLAKRVASFANVVEQAAIEGDAAACEIVGDAVNRLVHCVTTLEQRLGAGGPSVSLACGGSLLTQQTCLAEAFSGRMKRLGIEDLYFVEDPALAALHVAAAMI